MGRHCEEDLVRDCVGEGWMGDQIDVDEGLNSVVCQTTDIRTPEGET